MVGNQISFVHVFNYHVTLWSRNRLAQHTAKPWSLDFKRAFQAHMYASLRIYASLLSLASGVDLGPQIGGGAASLGEEAGEDGLDEGAEDNLSAVCDGKSHPEDQDELEGVVERYLGSALFQPAGEKGGSLRNQ